MARMQVERCSRTIGVMDNGQPLFCGRVTQGGRWFTVTIPDGLLDGDGSINGDREFPVCKPCHDEWLEKLGQWIEETL